MPWIVVEAPYELEKLAREFALELMKYFGLRVKVKLYNGPYFNVYYNYHILVSVKNPKSIRQLNYLFWSSYKRRKKVGTLK